MAYDADSCQVFIMLTYQLVLFYVLYSVCWPPVGAQDIKMRSIGSKLDVTALFVL